MKNISIWGATYSNVPAVELPTDNGTARFDDASVTTATASDVMSGKVFLASDGTITTGTATGGVDIPAFEVIWADDYSSQTVTCNKTFQECLNYYNSEFNGSAVEKEKAQSDADFTINGATVFERDSSSIRYTVFAGGSPLADIVYSSNGTLQYVQPSAAMGSISKPVATKGTVSNHSISITPSSSSTTGYITGRTRTGTAVSVSASELVSGTLSITENGTKNVTNYASVNVALPVNHLYVSTSAPTSSDGSVGDYWIQAN